MLRRPRASECWEAGLGAPCRGEELRERGRGLAGHSRSGPSACLRAAGPAASSGNALRRLFLCSVKKRVLLRAEGMRRGEGK